MLVAKGTTRELNPTVSAAEIDRALAADRVRNTAEYLAEFRDDISNFVSLEVVEACVGDHRELPRVPAVKHYGFVDPSGGSEDAMTLAISHRTSDRLIFIDAVREVRPPFSPAEVVETFAKLLKRYGITRVQGDRYAGEWPREAFRKRGVAYEPHAAPKSDLYRDLLPLLNSGQIVLPNDERLVAQIVGLERRTGRGTGREIIDHAPRAHDDVANAVAGAAALAAAGHGYRYDTSGKWIDGVGFGEKKLTPEEAEARKQADARWRAMEYWRSQLPVSHW
jgi:hypothetical protein